MAIERSKVGGVVVGELGVIINGIEPGDDLLFGYAGATGEGAFVRHIIYFPGVFVNDGNIRKAFVGVVGDDEIGRASCRERV